MDPSSLILDLERSFAPLTCRVEAQGTGRVIVRLIDRKGLQTKPYSVELRRLALPANRDSWVAEVLAAVERDGFRPAHQHSPTVAQVDDGAARMSLKGVRAALSRSFGKPSQVSRFLGATRALMGSGG